jgi:hypothetical protein
LDRHRYKVGVWAEQESQVLVLSRTATALLDLGD